jgi:hypothetical protein
MTLVLLDVTSNLPNKASVVAFITAICNVTDGSGTVLGGWFQHWISVKKLMVIIDDVSEQNKSLIWSNLQEIFTFLFCLFVCLFFVCDVWRLRRCCYELEFWRCCQVWLCSLRFFRTLGPCGREDSQSTSTLLQRSIFSTPVLLFLPPSPLCFVCLFCFVCLVG